MSRFVVVLPLAPLRTGESFLVTHWPLHVTVLAPFSTDAAASEITDAIARTIHHQPALTAVAGPLEMFGRRENIPVTVLAENPAVTRLHRTLVNAIRPFATDPDESAFTGRAFRAHVTVKHHARIHDGDELSLNQVALVDMAPRSAPGGRMVLSTLPLGALPGAEGAA
ncbi:2'-5' RNA ligase family protein [Glaciibacter sp. 2TAF33]|uniref:2'-5' RNA ligase family protein n=1 Tax=Glaciibacter sp. 2TAF33 TaxID=3233015 RepID=UPI003F8EFD7F